MNTRIMAACFLGMVSTIPALAQSGIAENLQPPPRNALSQSTGLFDFLATLTGHRSNGLPVEKLSDNAVQVAAARAIETGQGVRVYGWVTRKSLTPQARGSHVDVQILGENGDLLTQDCVSYTPASIPNNYRGILGRSGFSTTFPRLPLGSTLVRVIHNSAQGQACGVQGT